MGVIRSITVSLDRDVGEHSQKKIIAAIKMIKGVTSADALLTQIPDGIPDFHELELTVRVQNLLKDCGIETTEALLGKSETYLRGMENLGKYGRAEIKAALEHHGLRLKSY